MALHFRTATGIYARTLPFVLLRIGIGLLLGILTVVYFGAVGWIALSLVDAGTISGPIAVIGLVLATLLFFGFWRLFARYVLYLVKAAHIAVIAHVIETGEVPDNQLSYGKAQVEEYFVQASALFAIDQVVKSVIKQFNAAVFSLSGFVGMVPAFQQLVEVLRRAVALAATYIDEAIVAYLFVDDEPNKWRSARDGVVIYAKNWKPILASTILIVLGLYAAAIGLVLAFSPLAGILGSLSPTYEILGWAAVAGTVVTVYAGLLKPWVKTVVITTFLIEARDTTPESDTMAWIEERSDRFEELMRRAEEDASAPDAGADRDHTPGQPQTVD